MWYFIVGIVCLFLGFIIDRYLLPIVDTFLELFNLKMNKKSIGITIDTEVIKLEFQKKYGEKIKDSTIGFEYPEGIDCEDEECEEDIDEEDIEESEEIEEENVQTIKSVKNRIGFIQS